jgi:hypothetical protein
MLVAQGALLAGADRLELGVRHAKVLQILRDRGRTFVAERDVPFLGSSLVRVSFDRDMKIVVCLQTACHANEFRRLIRMKVRVVEIEMDPDRAALIFRATESLGNS